MDDARKRSLERRFLNARRFMWGIPLAAKGVKEPRNQPQVYDWLEKIAKKKGFRFDPADRGSYSDVERQLLREPRIDGLIRDVIVPTLNDLFTPDKLDFLRKYWMAGKLPDMTSLTISGIEDPTPFLDVNRQARSVDGWSEFAAVFFEEIEPSGLN